MKLRMLKANFPNSIGDTVILKNEIDAIRWIERGIAERVKEPKAKEEKIIPEVIDDGGQTEQGDSGRQAFEAELEETPYREVLDLAREKGIELPGRPRKAVVISEILKVVYGDDGQ